MGKSQLFMFDGMLVGYFAQSEFPRAPGRFRYIPFRGRGHYELQKQSQAGIRPRCYFDTGKEIVSFVVRDFPEYGEFVIGYFETLPRDRNTT